MASTFQPAGPARESRFHRRPAQSLCTVLSSFFAIFLSVFLAELCDKTQLATLLFAADPQRPPILVFLAAATVLAVNAGGLLECYLAVLPLKAIAGVGFIAIGCLSLYGHFTTNFTTS